MTSILLLTLSKDLRREIASPGATATGLFLGLFLLLAVALSAAASGAALDDHASLALIVSIGMASSVPALSISIGSDSDGDRYRLLSTWGVPQGRLAAARLFSAFLVATLIQAVVGFAGFVLLDPAGFRYVFPVAVPLSLALSSICLPLFSQQSPASFQGSPGISGRSVQHGGMVALPLAIPLLLGALYLAVLSIVKAEASEWSSFFKVFSILCLGSVALACASFAILVPGRR